MKLTTKQVRNLIRETIKETVKAHKKQLREATGGDGEFQLVKGLAAQHLEVGVTYEWKAGSDSGVSEFVDWVDSDGNPTQSDEFYLKFRDQDGFEWEAYAAHGSDTFVVGSGSDALYVKESREYDDGEDSIGESKIHEDMEQGTPNADAAKYKKALELSVNKLQEILHEMNSGSGEEGMSSYYVGTELENVVARLFKVAAWYKAHGQKR